MSGWTFEMKMLYTVDFLKTDQQAVCGWRLTWYFPIWQIRVSDR